jgi:exopolysaccharide biosynthesis polyprenyl glycosylphosphotransferase
MGRGARGDIGIEHTAVDGALGDVEHAVSSSLPDIELVTVDAGAAGDREAIRPAPDPALQSSPPLRRLLVAADVGILAIGTWIGLLWTTSPRLPGTPPGWLTLVAVGLVTVVAGCILLSAAGLYRRRICAVRGQELARTLQAVAVLSGFLAGALLLIGSPGVLRASMTAGAAWLVGLAIERAVFREWIHARRATGDFRAPVLVVGGSREGVDRTAALLSEHQVLGYEVRGVVALADAVRGTADIAALLRRAAASEVSGVVLDAGSLTGDELTGLAEDLAATALHVHISSGLRGIERRRITVAPVADETFLHVRPLGLGRTAVVTKRVVDVTIATLALVFAAPILLVAALAIWCTDRGPVLFRQERVGLDGERFTLYKLRTMVVDAEARREALLAENERIGPLFKLSSDPRVTRIGRFLRASSIDELPQLCNVLEGTMSLVGPRPALPDEVAQFDERLSERLTVKPGLTGLWQIEARDLPSFDLYRRYDLLYVQNWSLLLDISLIGRTAAVVGLRSLRAVLPRRAARAAVLE